MEEISLTYSGCLINFMPLRILLPPPPEGVLELFPPEPEEDWAPVVTPPADGIFSLTSLIPMCLPTG